MIFGMDVSTYNGGSLDFHRARREGIEFAFIRAWDRRTNAIDAQFYHNLQKARDAGMIVAAYHFIVPWENAVVNTDHVLRTIPEDVPIILDVEKDQQNGAEVSIELAQDIANRLRAAGRRLPLAYVPRWYWRDYMGQPDLRGLSDHGLWASQYHTPSGGSPQQIWPHPNPDNDRGWAPYGNASVRMLQFTSKSTIAGYAPLDADAFPGTREELAALLGGEEGMEFTPEDKIKIRLIHQQFTGNPYDKSSRDGLPFAGWEDFLPGGDGRATWVDYMRLLDMDIFNNLVRLSATKATLEKIVTELGNSGSFDKDAFLAEVKAQAKAVAAAEVYKVKVSVERAAEEQA